MDYFNKFRNDFRHKDVKDYTLIDKIFVKWLMFLGGFWTFYFYLFLFIHNGYWVTDTTDPENPVKVWKKNLDESDPKWQDDNYNSYEREWWIQFDYLTGSYNNG